VSQRSKIVKKRKMVGKKSAHPLNERTGSRKNAGGCIWGGTFSKGKSATVEGRATQPRRQETKKGYVHKGGVGTAERPPPLPRNPRRATTKQNIVNRERRRCGGSEKRKTIVE